ncbi:MAG: hypothetical protein QF492_08880 [Candidatus Krumholzibacteria bacterium]|jgi:hypothetical protein|nr:hypothetical protein [Candidatus Krumholzibacteria bacterium]
MNKIKTLLAIPTLALMLLVASCGGNRIILNLDLDSFMDEESRTFHYEFEIPVALPPDQVDQVPPVSEENYEPVTLPAELRDIVNLDVFEFDYRFELSDELLSGDVALEILIEVYLSESEEHLWDYSSRLLEIPHDIAPGGEAEVLEGSFGGEAFVDLFQNHEEALLGLRFRAKYQGGSGQVEGEVLALQLHAHIEGQESFF